MAELTQDELNNVRTLAQLVKSEPAAVDKFIESHGYPAPADPVNKALSLALIGSLMPAQNFEDAFAKFSTNRNFLGLASIIGMVGNIFKKKEGGTKVGNILRGIMGKGGAAGGPSPAELATMDPATQAYYRDLEVARLEAAKSAKEAKEKEEKEKKAKMYWTIGIIAFVVIFGTIVVIMVTRDKKKKS